MLQLSPARKNKINLTDYNCAQDIENRILMSDFSPFDLEIVEEILFSPLKISVRKLARAKETSEEELRPILATLSKTGLLSVEEDQITVDKEMRKYFEFQIQRFDPSFKPDMEFIQGLLRKVPIHVLPSWYALPRSSNNIFESIVEKHLLSPQIYQRYLLDLNFGDAKIQGVMEAVLTAPDFRISSSDLIAKFNLSRPEFEEIMLLLEFNIVCCVSYVREEDHLLEVVTPFYEWAQYLRFLKETDASAIQETDRIVKRRDRDYAFLEDASALLVAMRKKPLPRDDYPLLASLCQISCTTTEETAAAHRYLSHLTEKMCLIRLAESVNGHLKPLDIATEFLDMNLESRALYIYRQPHNRILSAQLPESIATERNIREAEKSIRRVLHGKWIFVDDFLKGVYVPLSEHSVVCLKKTGKNWRYTLPVYSEGEQALIRVTLFEWLFEAGLVSVGTLDGRECFAVTAFGRFFFEE